MFKSTRFWRTLAWIVAIWQSVMFFLTGNLMYLPFIAVLLGLIFLDMRVQKKFNNDNDEDE